jgi:hypothetical protein
VTGGRAVIAGTEDRQHAYVALSCGTDTNMACVFTVSPKLADLSGHRDPAWPGYAPRSKPPPPGQHHPPLRSAEPDPATDTQRAELTLTPEHPPGEMSHWITDLTAAYAKAAGRVCPAQTPEAARRAGPRRVRWIGVLSSRAVRLGTR